MYVKIMEFCPKEWHLDLIKNQNKVAAILLASASLAM
jgi:hypothetical protein